jgi:uncharacterized delta-60 repeat protein
VRDQVTVVHRRRTRARTAPLFVLSLLFQLGVTTPALAAGGDLDTSFGDAGKVIGPAELGGNAIAIQGDGKIVVVGSETNDLGHPAFGVARFDADGSLDATFGDGGTVTTVFRSGSRCFEYATAAAVQPDGGIVAVGLSYCRRSKFALARYDTDGTLDPTFGGNGKVLTALGDPLSCSSDAQAAAIQADGKIIAAGETLCPTTTGSRMSFGVARYDADGTLDSSFGGDGKVRTNFTAGSDIASGVAVQPDGKIVVAGTASEGLDAERFALARYETDGALDPTFGVDGKVITGFRGRRCGARAHPDGMALQPDGKIVAAGVGYCSATVGSPSHPRWALARYDTEGTLDPTFGGDGRVVTIFQRDSCGDEAYGGVAIQANGKIAAAGTTGCFARLRFTLARYRRDGRLDATFGGDGKVTTAFASGRRCEEVSSDVVIQPDRKIVAVGSSDCLDPSRSVMARYLPA